jgi:hypothetical protein
VSRRNISVEQFGTLYHGTDTPGLTELSQHAGGGPRYAGMRNSYGYNYATTQLQTAIDYARSAGGTPTVYNVSPKRKSEPWGPDPDSGPSGFHDGPRNKGTALELHENGSEVSLRFRSPLKVNQEAWVEDRAKDVTMVGSGLQDKKSYYGGTLSDFHTMGRSFS